MIRLYDTATREVRELELRDPGKVSIYLCGPTVQGPPHLGHGRATTQYDILVRYLRWRGLEVRLVSNVTDIDDKIIDRGRREDRDWREVAEACEAVWWSAMERLGNARPDDTPHATDYVDEMVTLIGELVDRGAAYVTDDGIYFSVASVDDYPLLAHQSLEAMLAGGGDREVFGAGNKRHPADFALWKFTKPGEPAWPSPWGDGRPGWHTECVAMSLDLLGEGFDLHAGGEDLRFPHHENERAQAVALGKRFANHWMHNAFIVDAEGEKMSKSIGNVDNLLDVLDAADQRCLRLILMQAHYRSPARIGRAMLDAAAKSLAGLDAFAARMNAAGIAVSDPAAADPDVLARFVAAMDDDLDTPKASALLFDTVRRANAALDAGDVATATALAAAAGEILSAVGLALSGEPEVPDEVLTKAAALDEARAARDFATADALRAELSAAGWIVETSAAGTTVRR